MAAVQAENVRTSFLFIGDLNGDHQEWSGYTTTNRNGVATIDFATVSSCEQVLIGHHLILIGTLDPLMMMFLT